MSLQKAVKAREVAGFRLVSESSGAHQCDVVPHQIAKNTAERSGLSQGFERLIGIAVQQSSPHSFAAVHAIFRAKVGNRITGDEFLLHEEIQEAANNTGSVQQCRYRPMGGTFTQPGLKDVSVYL